MHSVKICAENQCTMTNPFELIEARLSNIETLLLDIKHVTNNQTARQPESDKLLTIHQAAELVSLSVPTIYTLVSKAQIPVSKRGKRLYFSKQELTNWIKAGRKKTLAEISNDTDNFLSNRKRK